ncbi:uncharacterized protein [Dermacentor andersoni]|uniref:uncharacterized protein n=1 Tax=Dermacentor andersoni TaxID=34620 RepID=UPI003B3BC87F
MSDRRRDSRTKPSFEPRPTRHPPSGMPGFKPSPSLLESTPHLSRALLERQRRREFGDDWPMEHRRRPPGFGDEGPMEHRRRPPGFGDEGPMEHRRRPPGFGDEGPMEHRRRAPEHDDERFAGSASVPPIHFDGRLRDDSRDDRGHRGRRLPEEHDELSLASYDYRSPGSGDPRGPPGPPERLRRPQSTPRYGGDRDRYFGSPDRGRHSIGYPGRHGGERERFDALGDREERGPEHYRLRGDSQRLGDERNLEHRSGRMQEWPDDGPEWARSGPPYGDERARAGGVGQRPFVPEYSSSFNDERPPLMPCQESRRSASVPTRRHDWGPEDFDRPPRDHGALGWEEEFGSFPHRSGPAEFGEMERGPFSSRDHPGGNFGDPGTSGYNERPPRSSSRDRGYPCPREFQERGREVPGFAPYEEHLHSSPGRGRRPFSDGRSEGPGPVRFASTYQQAMPGPMGRKEYCPPEGVRDVRLMHDNAASDKRPMMPVKDEMRPAVPIHPKNTVMEQAAKAGYKEMAANPENPWPSIPAASYRGQMLGSGYKGPSLSKEGPLGEPAKALGGVPDRLDAPVPPPQLPRPAIPGRPMSSVDISQQNQRGPLASQCQTAPGARGPEQRSLLADKLRSESAPPLPATADRQRQSAPLAPPVSSVSQTPQSVRLPPATGEQRQLPLVAPSVTSVSQTPQSAHIPSATTDQQRQRPPVAPGATTLSQKPQSAHLPPPTAEQRQHPPVASCAMTVSQTPQSARLAPPTADQRQRPPLAPCATSVPETLQAARLPTVTSEQRQHPPVASIVRSVSQMPPCEQPSPATADQQQQRPPVALCVNSVPPTPLESAVQKPPSTVESKDDPPVASMPLRSPVEERPGSMEDRKLQRPISFPLPKGKLEQLASQVLRPNSLDKGTRAPTIGQPHGQVNVQSGNEKHFFTSDVQQRPVLSQGSCGTTQYKAPGTSLAPLQPACTLPVVSVQQALPPPPRPPSFTCQSFRPTRQVAPSSTSNPTQCNVSVPNTPELRPPMTTAYPQQVCPLTGMPIHFGEERYMTPPQQAGSVPGTASLYDFQQKQATTADPKPELPVPSPFFNTAGGQLSAGGALTRPPLPTPSYFTGRQCPSGATNVQPPTASPLSLHNQQLPTSSASQKPTRAPTFSQEKIAEERVPPKIEGQSDAKCGQMLAPGLKQKEPEGSGVHNTKVAVYKSAPKLSAADGEHPNSDVEMIEAYVDDTRICAKDEARATVGGAAQPVHTLRVGRGVTKSDTADGARLSDPAIQSKNQDADTEKQQPEPQNQQSTSRADETRDPKGGQSNSEEVPEKQVSLLKLVESPTDNQSLAVKKQETSVKDRDAEVKDSGNHLQNREPLAKQQNANVLNEDLVMAESEVLYGPRPPTTIESDKCKNTLITDNISNPSDMKSSSGKRPALNDHEVSSSTPECAVASSSTQSKDQETGQSGAPNASAGQKTEVQHTRQDNSKPTEKTETAPVSKKNEESSDCEKSGHSSERSSRATEDSHRPRSSKRRRRTYSSSDDKYDEDESDVENTNDGVCLSGRGNEGQVFGIPVVFKAISTTRTFWNIRGGQVARELEEVIGDNVVNQKINRAGFLCVNVATAADAVKLLNLKKLGGADVESVIPSMYLRHEAKIRGVPYHYTNEKLAEVFANVGVLSARRQLTVKRLHDGTYEEFPRSSVVLTFKPDATLPKTLELENEKFIVEEYIEAPLQCFKCLRFGHTSRACVSVGRCKNCGARYCDEECERRTPMCANCFGPHQATYVGCPRRREVAFASLWKRTFDLNAL